MGKIRPGPNPGSGESLLWVPGFLLRKVPVQKILDKSCSDKVTDCGGKKRKGEAMRAH